MREDELRQVRREHGGRLDDGVAHALGAVAVLPRDPDRLQAERGLLRLRALDFAARQARIHREVLVGKHLEPRDLGFAQQHAVLVRPQAHVVHDADNGDDEPVLARDLLAQDLDAREQVAALFLVRQPDEAVAKLDLERIDREIVLRARRGLLGGRGGGLLRGSGERLAARAELLRLVAGIRDQRRDD